MQEVLESRIRIRVPAASRKLRCGVKHSLAGASKRSDPSGGVGYRLRQAADRIRTGSAFPSTLTLLTLMAILEAGTLCPPETTCSAG